jgi:hypothetical protein
MGRFFVAGLPIERPSPRALVLAVLLAGAGCYPAPPTAGADLGTSEDAILSAARTMHGSSGFTAMNAAPYTTALPSAALVNVFVSDEGHDWYAAVAPEREGTGIVLPEGTLIVREVLGDDGEVATLTLMYKGAPGYNPDLGDYWFGVADPTGEPVVEDGVAKVGRLEACYGCHVDRPDDDFLFGVPAVQRPPATPAAR